jgi:hypothetical protein
MVMEVWYAALPEKDDRMYVDFPRDIDVSDPVDAWSAALAAAEDLHDEHDGWEASWPVTIILFVSETGPEAARFLVDREARPVFTAARLAAAPKSEG